MSGMNRGAGRIVEELSRKHLSELGGSAEQEPIHTKRQKIGFGKMCRSDLTRLIGNVDVLKNEDSDERYVVLNRSFLNSCMALASHGASLGPLFLQYEKFISFIKRSKDSAAGYDVEDIREFNFSLYDFEPFGEEEEVDMLGGTKDGQHKCSQGEIYKFLTRHFGVVCPDVVVNDDFMNSLEAFRRMEKMADFPFSKPLRFGKGPGMSFSMSRREDVGNHNRKVFEALTALRKDRNALEYVKNPEFFEDSSEEEQHSGNRYVIREVVTCKFYLNGKYDFFGNLTLRGFSRDGLRYVNMRDGRKVIFRDLEKSQVKLTYSKGEDVLYMLVMETMMIYKIVCRHPAIALNIYEHLMGAEGSN
ncbi:hypothetical protein [Encephalitozoon cuniculi GB-M1]|uniref:Uncharacterized protein n=1 Tax=Encephalitozoon cuniculi (strain GB-M1) TaxID=284813 RepID=Q8SUK0_ENCCU|nr:uncharacterized protein ECU08_1740 [Encephalitozoon cuniculi GB-M1]CAD26478.1 hypothetical protein [Encephalitozoon cuniculi GB-M1]